MSYKFMFVLNAIVAMAFGLAFLLVPEMALGQFRVDTYDATVLVGRFFGSAMIALGLVLWFVKGTEDAGVQKGLAMSLLASAVLGLIVNIIGVASGAIRENGWMTIVFYVLFALGYAFMLFLKPKMKE